MKIDRHFNKPNFPEVLDYLNFRKRVSFIKYLSAFHLVCAFMGLISKVYFVKFYVCILSCVHVLNVLLHNN